MDIADFIGKFRNHPVLFVGTGMSMRYLSNSYSWDGLLKKKMCIRDRPGRAGGEDYVKYRYYDCVSE